MDLKTGLIVDMELVHVCQVANSGAMEKEGLRRILERLKDDRIGVKLLATDRSIQVTAFMAKVPIIFLLSCLAQNFPLSFFHFSTKLSPTSNHPRISGGVIFFGPWDECLTIEFVELKVTLNALYFFAVFFFFFFAKEHAGIIHEYDVWHFGKSLRKKLVKACQKKSFDILRQWIPSIVNHLWWSAGTCHEDATLLKEKWQSVIYHITNKHTWTGKHEQLFKQLFTVHVIIIIAVFPRLL